MFLRQRLKSIISWRTGISFWRPAVRVSCVLSCVRRELGNHRREAAEITRCHSNKGLGQYPFGRHRIVRIVHQTQFHISNRSPNLHKTNCVCVAVRSFFERFADLQTVSMNRNPGLFIAWNTESNADGGFGETINRQHGRPSQSMRCERPQESFTKLNRYRFGTVQY